VLRCRFEALSTDSRPNLAVALDCVNSATCKTPFRYRFE